MNWSLDTFDDLRECIWTALQDGAASQEHPFHVASLATRRADGAAVRAMVLRRADGAQRLLTCSTDLRAAKTAEIQQCPQVEWMFYAPRSTVQIRLRGPTAIHAQDAVARAAWESTPWMIRAHYASPHAPGSVLPDSRLERLGDLAQQAASIVNQDAGFAHFGLLVTQVTAIDWLQISRTGPRHAGLTWNGVEFAGAWLA